MAKKGYRYKPSGAEVCSSLSKGMIVGAAPLFLMALFLFGYYCSMMGDSSEDAASARAGLFVIFLLPAGLTVLMDVVGVVLTLFGRRASTKKGVTIDLIAHAAMAVLCIVFFVIMMCTVGVGSNAAAMCAVI